MKSNAKTIFSNLFKSSSQSSPDYSLTKITNQTNNKASQSSTLTYSSIQKKSFMFKNKALFSSNTINLNYKSNNYLNSSINKRNIHDIIYCKQPYNELKEIINTDKLMIFSDFDYTITKRYTKDFKDVINTISILQESSLMPESYKKQYLQIYDHYKMYEIRLDLDEDYRKSQITKWFKEIAKLIITENISHELINEICKAADKSKMLFREEFAGFLTIIEEKEIPFVIVTAGISDVVDCLLTIYFEERYLSLKKKNLITIIGNSLRHSDANKEDFSIHDVEIINTFNKADVLKNKVSQRDKTQIMMLGDHMWDADAINYFIGEKIRFGFGNFTDVIINTDPKYAEFVRRYDILVINDGTFKMVNKLLI